MRIIDKEDQNKRTPYFLVMVGLLFSILILRLYYLQIIKGEEYLNKSERNGLRTNIVNPVRGRIYDKNGVILVSNTIGYQLIHKNSQNISQEELELLKKMELLTEQEVNDNLKNLNNKTKEKLLEIYKDSKKMAKISNQEYRDVVNIFYKTLPEGSDKILIIDEDLDPKVAFVESEKLSDDNIDIIEYDKRYYHKNEIASHVIGNVKLISEKEYENLKDSGYSKTDLIGKDGIEKYYDKELKGSTGQEFVEVDARGNILNKLDEEPAKSGDNIYLSIDFELQKYMTEKFAGKTGTFIAIDVNTGKIITYVSYPEVNLNVLSSRITKEKWTELINSSKKPLLNRGIGGLFPPGSTAKVVSGAAILESGISVNDTYYSTGEATYANTTFRDAHRGGYGITNFYKSIYDSVNTYYYNFIQKVDRDKYFSIAKDFGIGELTNIDIPGENAGVLPTPEWKKKKFKDTRNQVWVLGDLINMSIGQGYMLMTPMQVLMMYQAIANNGVMLKPTFIEYFESQSGEKKNKEVEILRELMISKKTLNEIKIALRMTVTLGTAKGLNNLGVEVSAKTGTAQNSHGLDHSWMVGYFPSSKPKIAFVALVENGGYGSLEAGDKVAEFIKKYYEPKDSEENLKGNDKQ